MVEAKKSVVPQVGQKPRRLCGEDAYQRRLRRSRQETKAILRGAHPAHEGRAVRFPAPAAVTVREEERRRRDRKAHRPAQAAALELAHGAILAKNAIHMPNRSSVLAT